MVATCLIKQKKHADLVEGAYKSGQKNAHKLVYRLELRGYYQGRAVRKVAA